MNNCRGCGKPMIWGISKNGKMRIPLDPKAPVYYVLGNYNVGENGEGADIKATIVERAQGYFVTHFATCPNANDFSRSKKNLPGVKEAEQLYSGQCNHQIPIGQPCFKCERL